MQIAKPTRRLLALLLIITILTVGLAFSLVAGYYQARNLCNFQERSFTIQRLQILDDAKLRPPSKLILKALHLPPYNSASPLYAEQIDNLKQQRDRRLAILGTRPSC